MIEIREPLAVDVEISADLELLKQALSALSLTLETLGEESVMPEDADDHIASIFITSRFPLYLKTLRVINRDLKATVNDIQTVVDAIFAEQKTEGVAK